MSAMVIVKGRRFYADTHDEFATLDAAWSFIEQLEDDGQAFYTEVLDQSTGRVWRRNLATLDFVWEEVGA